MYDYLLAPSKRLMLRPVGRYKRRARNNIMVKIADGIKKNKFTDDTTNKTANNVKMT